MEALKSVKKSTVINCFYKCKVVPEKVSVQDSSVQQTLVGALTRDSAGIQDYFCFDDDDD